MTLELAEPNKKLCLALLNMQVFSVQLPSII
jgi:hypothetical protein